MLAPAEKENRKHVFCINLAERMSKEIHLYIQYRDRCQIKDEIPVPLITNRAQGPCWGILAQGRSSMDQVQ